MSENLPAVMTSDIEKLLIEGDLSKLSPPQRVTYFKAVCESVGLNPLTKPFDYHILNGKLVLYAKRDATDQLRKIHQVSIRISSRSRVDELYIVTAEAEDKTGRRDEAMGVVNIAGLKGEMLANAMLRCETKAKRRVTLSICGLGLLDQTELDDVAPENKSQPFNNDPFGKKERAAALEQQPPEQEASPAESSAAEPDGEDLGKYVVRVGKKFAGKTLDEIDMFDLDGYVKYFKGEALKKPLSAPVEEFVQIAEAYLSSKEVRS